MSVKIIIFLISLIILDKLVWLKFFLIKIWFDKLILVLIKYIINIDIVIIFNLLI